MEKWLGLGAPRWMTLSLIVLKWIMVITPFLISSVVYFAVDVSGVDEWMWTCIYIMSLMKIIDMVDEK